MIKSDRKVIKSLPSLSKARFTLSTIGVVMIFGFALTPIFYGLTHAYGYPSNRSIDMSSDAAGATGVTYEVSLIPTATGQINGIVVDFCDTDPIIGDNCSAPPGMDISAATLAVNPNSSGFTGGSWSLTPITSGGMETLAITSSTNTTYTSGSITFQIGNITNPSSNNTSFFGRLLTYSAAGGATGYQSTVIGTPLDAGGVAITTSNTLVITSRIQEEITFCIYTSLPCSGSAINLGDTNDVLSSLGPFVDKTTHYLIQTNASQGASIAMQGNVLQSGASAIEASAVSGTGTVAGTDYASAAGTNQFGICTTVIGGITITPVYPYNDVNCGNATQTSGTGTTGGTNSALFAFNITNSTGTYGDVIANVIAGSNATGQIDFMANTAVNTIAGVYSTTLNFIATGTY